MFKYRINWPFKICSPTTKDSNVAELSVQCLYSKDSGAALAFSVSPVVAQQGVWGLGGVQHSRVGAWGQGRGSIGLYSLFLFAWGIQVAYPLAGAFSE